MDFTQSVWNGPNRERRRTNHAAEARPLRRRQIAVHRHPKKDVDPYNQEERNNSIWRNRVSGSDADLQTCRRNAAAEMNGPTTFPAATLLGLSVSECDANCSFLVLDFDFALPRQPPHRHRYRRSWSFDPFFHRAQAGCAVGAQKMPYQTSSFTNRFNFRHRRIPPCRQFGILTRAWKYDRHKFLQKVTAQLEKTIRWRLDK